MRATHRLVAARARRLTVPSLVVVAAGLVASSAAPSDTRTILIRHASVVDVVAGRVLDDHAVLVRGDRIERVGPDAAVIASVPTAAGRTVDAGGRFLIPGLWDMHVHALWDPIVTTTALPLLVAHGVTGVRDMGGSLDVLRSVRAGIDAGTLRAPRLVAAGLVIDGPRPVDPSISVAVSSADEAVAAVGRLADAQVDFLKVYTLLPASAFKVVMAEAARRGLRVSGHVPAGISPTEAAEAGMWSIEHMRAELGGYCTRATETACGPMTTAFRAHGTWQVPTLVVRRARAYLDDPARASDPRLSDVPRGLREAWLAARLRRLEQRDDAAFRAMRDQYADERWLAGHLHRSGVGLVAGSDAGADFVFHGSGLHDELAELVEAGLTPLQALRAATSDAARLLGRAGATGQVVAGADADLVLIEDDPLADIGAVRRIHGVMSRGAWLERAELDRVRATVRAAAR